MEGLEGANALAKQVLSQLSYTPTVLVSQRSELPSLAVNLLAIFVFGAKIRLSVRSALGMYPDRPSAFSQRTA